MSTETSPILVVKTGGRIATDETMMTSLAEELVALSRNGTRVLLIHGGGSTISSLQERFGVKPLFADGLRQTDPEEMPLVDMALAGKVNKQLVRLLTASGGRAWGLSGADANLIIAESRSGDAETDRTGVVTKVDSLALNLCWQAGFIPVLAPVASDSKGRGINVNADEAALATAVSLSADRLVFVSDVRGVLEENNLIPILTAGMIEEKIAAGIIDGGMIPKTRSAARAVADGVGEVIIGDYQEKGNLDRLLSGDRGTRIAAGGVQYD